MTILLHAPESVKIDPLPADLDADAPAEVEPTGPSADDAAWWAEQTRDDHRRDLHPTADPADAEAEAAYRAAEAERFAYDAWIDQLAGEREAEDRLTRGCLL